jgi:unsaturated rhamnogalacturonyl hydrolase
MPTSEDATDQHRWWLLRWAPRHDSGVIYAPEHEGEVWVDAFHDVVPALVATADFAPADMQYRMHREHLWNRDPGLYGERFNVDMGTWIDPVPSALGNARAALGMARALAIGGDATPAEMRGRWQRETAALIAAMGTLEVEPGTQAGAALAEARQLGTAGGWLPGQ